MCACVCNSFYQYICVCVCEKAIIGPSAIVNDHKVIAATSTNLIFYECSAIHQTIKSEKHIELIDSDFCQLFDYHFNNVINLNHRLFAKKKILFMNECGIWIWFFLYLYVFIHFGSWNNSFRKKIELRSNGMGCKLLYYLWLNIAHVKSVWIPETRIHFNATCKFTSTFRIRIAMLAYLLVNRFHCCFFVYIDSQMQFCLQNNYTPFTVRLFLNQHCRTVLMITKMLINRHESGLANIAAFSILFALVKFSCSKLCARAHERKHTHIHTIAVSVVIGVQCTCTSATCFIINVGR